MTFNELLGLGGGGLFVILCLIQIAPIKLNPWSAIAKAIGRAINGELIEEVKTLKDKLDRMENIRDEGEAKQARTRVLRFGDECRQGTIKHSKEHFDEILSDISSYNEYCRTHPHFPNDRMTITSQLIKERYKQCMEKNSFI